MQSVVCYGATDTCNLNVVRSKLLLQRVHRFLKAQLAELVVQLVKSCLSVSLCVLTTVAQIMTATSID